MKWAYEKTDEEEHTIWANGSYLFRIYLVQKGPFAFFELYLSGDMILESHSSNSLVLWSERYERDVKLKADESSQLEIAQEKTMREALEKLPKLFKDNCF